MQTVESTKKRTAIRACAALSALAIALLLSPASQSQDREHGPEQMQQRMEQRLTHLKEDLGLSDQQVESLRPIFADQMREMRQFRQSRRGGAEGDRGEGREAMRKLRTDTRAKIANVLNEEQLTKFDTLNRNRDRQRFGGGQRGPRPNRDGAGPPHPPRGDGFGLHGDGPPPPPRGDGFRPHGDGQGPPPPGHPPLPPEPKS